MRNPRKPVYIATLEEGIAVAFEATNDTAADELIQTPWFAQSLHRFYAAPCEGSNERSAWQIRAATSTEAFIYRGWLAEFSEEADDLLIAPIRPISEVD